MARTFTWVRSIGGNFDGAGNWGIVSGGTLILVADIPTPADIATFNGVSVTIGSIGSFGTAGTVDVGASTVSLIGGIQFGAFALTASSFTVAADGTLGYVAGFQAAPQTALVVGANATLSVAGLGALVTVRDTATGAGDLQVLGTGTLALGAGGSVLADILDLAGSGASGAVAILDAGSATPDAVPLLAAGWLAVGDGGAASLHVTNGALATAGIVTVGFGEAQGTGSGTLAADNAGQIAATGYAAFGYGAGDTGVGSIGGAGSLFASAGLFVGNAGTGTLTVANGATLTTTVEAGDTTGFAGAIANLAGSGGALIVTGAGAGWTLAGRFDIGAGGPGTLEVLAGAAVHADSAAVPLISVGGTSYDATFSLVQASVLVRDAGSTLDAGGGPIYVGNAGTASLTVALGGAVIAAAPAADYAAVIVGLNGGTGTLSLTDAGTRLDSFGQLDVGGGGGGAGTLRVLAGAMLWSGNQPGDPLAGLSLADGAGSTGAATIDGAGSLLTNTGRLDVGRFGAGVLTIGNGGTLATHIAAASAAVQPASLLLGVNAGASGTIGVTGAGSVLSTDSAAIVGLAGAGTLQVLDGSAVGIGTDLGIANPLGSDVSGNGQGLVTVGGAALTVGGALAIGAASGNGSAGGGTLAVAAGGMVRVAGSATLAAGSTIAITGGGLEIGGTGSGGFGGVTIDAGGMLAGAGSVQAAVLINGTLAATGGVLTLGGASGPGVLEIGTGGTLDPGGLGGGTVDFVGAGTLLLHAAASGTALRVGVDGGTIDMAGLAVSGAAYANGTLMMDLAGSQMLMALAAPPPAGGIAVVSDGVGGTDVVLPCFAAGTRLATPCGWMAVEDVRPGDTLVTVAGRAVPVLWAGGRTLDCRRHARPWEVHPVRVRAGAVAAGVPARDVRLSPDHAVFVQGSLIPVRYLLNGISIVQEAAARISYHHIELASHDVLLAEGLPAESFLDTGNRSAFAEGKMPMMLHPDFGPEALARAIWAEKGCAPLVLEGEALARARRLLLRRATALGHKRTGNPVLRVLAGARALPAQRAGTRWQVALPAGLAGVRLVSRVWVPAHMRPEETDTRRLGVAIALLALDGREVALDSPALAEGWLPAEPDWRWTDGAAVLPVAGARLLAFDLAMAGEYWATPAGGARDAAGG